MKSIPKSIKIIFSIYLILYVISYVIYIYNGGYGSFADAPMSVLSMPWNLIMYYLWDKILQTSVGAKVEIFYHLGFLINVLILFIIGIFINKKK